MAPGTTGPADLTAAVVGLGFIGRVHVEALRRLGIRVSGVLGSSVERTIGPARELGVGRIYSDLEAVCADQTVDVVHIASPNRLHFEQARQVIAAGKHVVCEKPLAMDVRQAAELSRLAASAGVVHAVNYNLRHYAQVIEARERVAGIAEQRLVTGSYRQDWLADPSDWNWRIDPHEGGPLRAVADIGSHLLDLTMFVTGRRITAVFADVATFLPTRQRPRGRVETFAAATGNTEEVRVDTEDAAVLLLQFDGGARGVLTISQVSVGHRNDVELEVTGADGSVAWRSLDNERLWLGHRDAANQLLDRDPALIGTAAAQSATLPAGHPEGFRDTFAALYRSVYARVADRSAQIPAPYATFVDGHQQALLMDAVLASARSSRWVEVEAAETPEGEVK